MDLFLHYEEEFVDLKQTIEQKVKTIPSFIGGQRTQEVRNAELDIQDAEQTLRSMNLSARNVASPNNVKLLQKCKEYENDIEKLKSELRKAEMKINVGAERDSLFSSSGGIRDDMMATSMDQRARLLSNTESLDKSSIQLQEAMRTAEETVQVGMGVMEDLDRQTNTMMQIKEKLGHINDSLFRAKGILRTMSRRVVTNKLIMAFIMLVLLAAIGAVVYFKWFSK